MQCHKNAFLNAIKYCLNLIKYKLNTTHVLNNTVTKILSCMPTYNTAFLVKYISEYC